ncbi:MAG: YdcF family protein [bacterium]
MLGGGVTGGGDYAQLTDSGDRAIVGARMYRRGLTKTLVTSGSSIPGLGTYVNVAEATTVLKDLGVPDDAILRMPDPKNTSEEMRSFSAMVAQKQWKRVGVVTSAFHMRRAMRLAQANQLDVHPLPSDYKANVTYEGVLSWVPDGAGFLMVQKACWEYLGAAVGR